MITKKLFLHFPRCETENPIVYHLVKNYDLIVNLFRAKVAANEEGYLVLDITGEEENIEKACNYIRGLGVSIETAESGIIRDLEKCTHCGNCVTHCPTKALHIPDLSTMKVEFDPHLCIACSLCVSNCPFGACSSIF